MAETDGAPILDNIKFWMQVMADARKTIICAPEYESRIKSGLEARGLAGLTEVIVSAYLPDERQIYIIDTPGMEADQRQALQLGRRSFFGGTL